MRRTLLVAEGTFSRPLLNIVTTAGGITLILALGIVILRMPVPGWAQLAGIAALLIATAWVKGRYGGMREFRVERPVDGSALRLSGRFDNGEIPANAPEPLSTVERHGDTLVLSAAPAGLTPVEYRVSSPAFKPESMDRLATLITELPEIPEETLLGRYRQRTGGLKAFDARGLLLVRFVETPSFMALTWTIAGITVVFWLLFLGMLGG